MPVHDPDQLVEHPTWLEHIRYFFAAEDIDHMRLVAKMDLASYDGVKAKATSIFFQTMTGKMPPDPARRWSQNRVKTFQNWIVDQFPMGQSPVDLTVFAKAAERAAAPTRRDAANLSAPEVERLGKTFKALMDRDPNDKQSYFAVAGIHWFPEPAFCVHHEPRYNPWHRVYIDKFEAALRSVPGSEDITMPYWDITAPLPEWLFKPPFDGYTLQLPAAPAYPAGTKTVRLPRAQIEQNVVLFDIPNTIRDALNAPQYDRFAFLIEEAHDSGHGAIGGLGGAMSSPDIASFDPIFWFFHCNWERMWWSWQKRYRATDLASFRATLKDPSSALWLDTPPFNELKPFTETADETIDASRYDYEAAPERLFADVAVVASGNVPAGRRFTLAPQPRVSIRIKDIARLGVGGSFTVHLLGDGKEIARRAFFQASQPEKCVGCVERAKVDIDFIVDRAAVAGKELDIRFESLMADRARTGPEIPLSQLGSPTINVRELLISK